MPLLPRPTGPRSLRPGCLGDAVPPTSGPRTSFQKKEPFPVGGTVQGPGRAASAGRSATSGRPAEPKQQRRHRRHRPTRQEERPQPGPDSHARLLMAGASLALLGDIFPLAWTCWAWGSVQRDSASLAFSYHNLWDILYQKT